MRALGLTTSWPVGSVAAGVLLPDGTAHTTGDVDEVFHIASISKMFVGWAALIACEEGVVALDQPMGQSGCTLRHLLAHAGGYAFDGPSTITRPGVRRIYSNSGIELVADELSLAAGMPFAEYLEEAVLQPLGMRRTSLRSSPAHGMYSTVDDLLAFARELRAPQLLGAESALAHRTVQFPTLAGLVPGIGRFDPCPWGLGSELRGTKQPHWTGTHNSPDTFGHFGAAGTLLWVDPGARVACIALTDRRYDDWSAEALRYWPQLADAVLAEAAP